MNTHTQRLHDLPNTPAARAHANAITALDDALAILPRSAVEARAAIEAAQEAHYAALSTIRTTHAAALARLPRTTHGRLA